MTKEEKVIEQTQESKNENDTYFVSDNEILNRYMGTKNYQCESSVNFIKCAFDHGSPVLIRALSASVTTSEVVQMDRSAGTILDWTVRLLYHKSGSIHRMITSFSGNCQKIDRNVRKF